MNSFIAIFNLYYKYIIPYFKASIKQILTSSLALTLIFSSPVALANAEIMEIITVFEKKYNIPTGLLLSIAMVESGLKPFAVNIEGKTSHAENVEKSKMIIKTARDRGIRNIDIGVMQINFHYHEKNFGTIEDMLDREKNIEYAAQFLIKLKEKYDSWHKAARYYHSPSPLRNIAYAHKVILAWLENRG